MRKELSREAFHDAIDTTLSGLQGNPFLAQRVISSLDRNNQVDGKRRLPASLALLIILMLAAGAALAIALLTPRDIVEQVAVPLAQENNQGNYTPEQLAALLSALNDNGITLDDGSRMISAFKSGHGYWKREAIHEICVAAFGDEGQWSIEQRYWYGEIMVSVGLWDHNIYLLPGIGDLSEDEAKKLAVEVLEKTYKVDLPTETDDIWKVGAGFGINTEIDDEGNGANR